VQLKAIFAVAALLPPASGVSQEVAPPYFESGYSLYEKCAATKDSPKQPACLGYVEGITDALTMSGTVCPPKDVVNVGQAQDVILKYLRDNPLSWHVSAALLASAALFEAFPCKQQ
jgi:Rap1a immunity proteins